MASHLDSLLWIPRYLRVAGLIFADLGAGATNLGLTATIFARRLEGRLGQFAQGDRRL